MIMVGWCLGEWLEEVLSGGPLLFHAALSGGGGGVVW